MAFDDIPEESLTAIKRRLINQIEDMNDAELRIVARSQDSLATYIAEAFQAIAKLVGFVIALPIGWAVTIAENLWGGLKAGLEAGFNAGRPPKRRS